MWLVPLAVVVMVAAAGMAISSLYDRADQSRNAQVEIGALRLTLDELQNSALAADPAFGGSPALARQMVADAKATIETELQSLAQTRRRNRELVGLGPAVRALYPGIDALLALGASPGGFAGSVQDTQVGVRNAIFAKQPVLAQLDRIAATYARDASRARAQATIGSATTLLFLLGGFLLFYLRSACARRRAQTDAVTDALTGLRNRRALNHDFPEFLDRARSAGTEIVLAMFDLDGFKQYNDTFGHGAGDTLLSGLAERLAEAMGSSASSYRMGGDEFCIVAQADASGAAQLVDVAADALSASGDGWKIGCSYGVAWAPSETETLVDALRLADQRMYASKASRSSTGQQTAAALVQVLAERGEGLDAHAGNVAELAVLTAEHLNLSTSDIHNIRLAAELHDIGKAAIPDAILNKSGPLDEAEWEFIYRHTIIGERIVLAAPALESVARMVRSSHERVDGSGYPDGLVGDAIPLGSRIIAVADAFDAMMSHRPYSPAFSHAPHALAELRRCAGTQFDPEVVSAFEAVLRTQDALPRRAGAYPPR